MTNAPCGVNSCGTVTATSHVLSLYDGRFQSTYNLNDLCNYVWINVWIYVCIYVCMHVSVYVFRYMHCFIWGYWYIYLIAHKISGKPTLAEKPTTNTTKTDTSITLTKTNTTITTITTTNTSSTTTIAITICCINLEWPVLHHKQRPSICCSPAPINILPT